MKTILADFVSTIALLTTDISTGGCAWLLLDEPNSIKSIKD